MSYKVCPACAETVQAKAVKCKHCGEDLSSVSARYSVGDRLRMGCAALFAISVFPMCFVGDARPRGERSPSSASASAATSTSTVDVREEAAARAAAAVQQRERLAQQRRDAEAAARPKLKCLAYTWSREYGYITLEGQVKNLTDEPIDGLQAVGSFYKGDTFVTSDSGMVEYQPLLPKQTSPFRVMLTDNPAIDGATVEFKTLFGGTITTEFPR